MIKKDVRRKKNKEENVLKNMILRIRELNPGLRRLLRGERWSLTDKAPS